MDKPVENKVIQVGDGTVEAFRAQTELQKLSPDQRQVLDGLNQKISTFEGVLDVVESMGIMENVAWEIRYKIRNVNTRMDRFNRGMDALAKAQRISPEGEIKTIMEINKNLGEIYALITQRLKPKMEGTILALSVKELDWIRDQKRAGGVKEEDIPLEIEMATRDRLQEAGLDGIMMWLDANNPEVSILRNPNIIVDVIKRMLQSISTVEEQLSAQTVGSTESMHTDIQNFLAGDKFNKFRYQPLGNQAEAVGESQNQQAAA